MLATCWYSSSVSQSKEIVTVRFCFDMHATLQPGGTAFDSKPVQCQFDCLRGHHTEIGWAGDEGGELGSLGSMLRSEVVTT